MNQRSEVLIEKERHLINILYPAYQNKNLIRRPDAVAADIIYDTFQKYISSLLLASGRPAWFMRAISTQIRGAEQFPVTCH